MKTKEDLILIKAFSFTWIKVIYMGSFNFSSKKISVWKSTGIFNYLDNSNMNAVGDSRNDLPALKNDGRMYAYLSGNYFTQNKVIIPNNKNVINMYCVYEL